MLWFGLYHIFFWPFQPVSKIIDISIHGSYHDRLALHPYHPTDQTIENCSNINGRFIFLVFLPESVGGTTRDDGAYTAYLSTKHKRMPGSNYNMCK